MRSSSTLLAILLVGVFAPSVSIANNLEPCPGPAEREDKAAVRALAKKWFEKGEASVRERDDVNAIRAFQCSMSLVPHGYTAFNLAEVAERVGDLDLAITHFDLYLQMLPVAEDRPEVEKRIAALKERLEKALAASKILVEEKPGPPPAPVEPPRKVVAEPRPVIEQPHVPMEPSSVPWYRSPTVAWVGAGAGLALVGTGIAFRFMSQNKLDDSWNLWNAKQYDASRGAYSSAENYAYAYYAFVGVGTVAIVGSAVSLLFPASRHSPVEVTLLPAGGAQVSLGGRF